MKTTKLFSIAFLVGSMFIGQNLFSQDKMMKEDTKMVGGAAMYHQKIL